ncbi:exopolysaccharide biosynthesis protein [Phormidium yuhuli AB48]|uniref:Exopolysaccharide biosynthesis protein n=1 Tax=Phormidium yuhuli AB48 TaxID=2940671 RepID=A0ABY5ATJ1_9CYAN|nr:exopolysaccharide biosynthesis protein [Phormidium yuhuli]USR92200.1 exopolysaccharide biosynthesis protein [Phormidium yuhuli AB48]
MSKKLSVELQGYFFSEERGDRVSLSDVVVIAGERAFGFLFVLLSIPSALPIPAPGYSIPFGVLIFWLSGQLVLGRKRPYLLKRWLSKDVPLKTVQGILRKGLPWLRRIEVLSRPRWSFICTRLEGRVVIGVALALMGISMMTPIPLTNTLPAIGVFVTGFGLFGDDGVITLGGLVICVMGLILTLSIIIFGYEAVSAVINMIRQ